MGMSLPSDWKKIDLHDCVRPEAPICYGILMPGKSVDDGVPVIKVRDIYGGKIDQSNLLLTDPRIDEAYSRSRLTSGDLLITIRGTTGRVALVPPNLDGANITQDTARVRLTTDVCAHYLYHSIQSQDVQDQISLRTIGQAVKGINIYDVKRLKIGLPPLEEQRAIAEALSDVDALINALDALITKKRHIKQGTMQQLLTGKKRLPGFSGKDNSRKKMPDWLFGRLLPTPSSLPPDWELVAITSVAILESGHTPARNQPKYWNGKIPWVSLHDSKHLDVREIFQTGLSVTELGIANSSARILPKGTVVFSRTATIGKSTVLGRDMATSQDFANYICGPRMLSLIHI